MKYDPRTEQLLAKLGEMTGLEAAKLAVALADLAGLPVEKSLSLSSALGVMPIWVRENGRYVPARKGGV